MGKRRVGIHVVLLLLALALMVGGFWARLKDSQRVNVTGVSYLAKRAMETQVKGCDMVALPCSGEITVDGAVDEAVWKQAEWFTGFHQLGSLESPATATSAQVRFSRDTIYIAMICWEPAMDTLVAQVTQRDGQGIWADDCVEIFMDPRRDGRGAYQWIVNSRGALYDIEHAMQSVNGRDRLQGRPEWNSGARCGVTRFADRWQVELAIPAADVGLAVPLTYQQIGLLLARERYASAPAEGAAPAAKGAKPAAARELSSTRCAPPLDKKYGFLTPIRTYPVVALGAPPIDTEAVYCLAAGESVARVRVTNNGAARVAGVMELETTGASARKAEQPIDLGPGQTATLRFPYSLSGEQYSLRLAGRTNEGVFFRDRQEGRLPPAIRAEAQQKGEMSRFRHTVVTAQVALGSETRGNAWLTITALSSTGQTLATERLAMKKDASGVTFRLNNPHDQAATLKLAVFPDAAATSPLAETTVSVR